VFESLQFRPTNTTYSDQQISDVDSSAVQPAHPIEIKPNQPTKPTYQTSIPSEWRHSRLAPGDIREHAFQVGKVLMPRDRHPALRRRKTDPRTSGNRWKLEWWYLLC
jgi:hypothetical protein